MFSVLRNYYLALANLPVLSNSVVGMPVKGITMSESPAVEKNLQ